MHRLAAFFAPMVTPTPQAIEMIDESSERGKIDERCKGEVTESRER